MLIRELEQRFESIVRAIYRCMTEQRAVYVVLERESGTTGFTVLPGDATGERMDVEDLLAAYLAGENDATLFRGGFNCALDRVREWASEEEDVNLLKLLEILRMNESESRTEGNQNPDA